MSVADGPGRDRVFISYAGRDRAWAEWVTWQLRAAGYHTEFDRWDWDAGDNAQLRMNEALERAEQVVALLSEAYFERERWTTEEWTALLAMRKRLVPLKIEPVTPPALLRPVIYRELYGLDAEQATRVLLEAVGGVRGPDREPVFPGEHVALAGGSVGPRLPGVLPEVWNVPARVASFTGRDGLLLALRERLEAGGGPVVVQALHGMGGVGKTSLAVEYAHRFANGYELVWWIDAEQVGLVGEQMGGLAVAAGWVVTGTETPVAVAEAQRRLRTGTGWLVVFDNADRPVDVQPWLPQGPGHVVVTSRNPAWRMVAAPVKVDVFARGESVRLLRRLAPTLTDTDADGLAGVLGDLPLAVAQAGGVLAETSMPAGEYRRALTAQAGQVLTDGTPPGYRVPLAAAVRVSVDRLGEEDPAAVQMLRLCAFLAPEPVPVEVFTTAPDGVLPEPLAAIAGSLWSLRHAVGRLGRYGLATLDENGLRLHRLTQAILRDQLIPEQRADQRGRAEQVIAAAQPDNGLNPVHWPRWAALLPHLLALHATAGTHPDLYRTAIGAAGYLLVTDRPAEAGALCQWVAASTSDPAERGQAFVLSSAALLNLGRPEEYREVVRAGLDAVRGLREPYLHGHLNALAALAAYRHDALESAVVHLVRSARAMQQADPTDPATPWGWHDLAMVYSYIGFHGHAVSAIERARTLAAAVGLPEEMLAAPGIRVRNATSLDHHGDAEGCVRVLGAVAADLARHEHNGQLGLIRPSGLAAYGYAVARLAALGHRLDVDACAVLRQGGEAQRSRELRALGQVCLAIGNGQPGEALELLETVEVTPDTLGPAEVPRLRALANLRAGDFRAAYEADREAVRVAAAGADRLRDTFIEGVAARLEYGELRRTAAWYADDTHQD
ncbi:MAG TPA: FxSxx-COOH system tetratricopeptide repeat protein [Micromonosporaceae bacterium]|nr:FxSxx-COOH system tetratricopeptide repeat protein [Micromonosporaceae bacterium]